ncbi:GNAT family N-acetyltransferase [Marinigracilibium pacificum]|uniref:GNAT family N-acetyltransferase n=1 Tax=Marinigracilibium pacificum TaxID=2729599 RepID=A0A848IZU9_9BACT|nr:N-acetyltransferase [Marinigracilibium pacificum]NMM48911.1 GNAT family N-acetyltransferase [Marinigracilibium pacificum]
MKLHFRKANSKDIDFLVALEQTTFPEFQQSAKINLKRGLKSSFQEIIIVEDKTTKDAVGSAVLFKYKHMLRIYSIGILAKYQNYGIGNELLEYIKEFAISNNYKSIKLEARENNPKLIDWYLSKGFVVIKTLKDYYMANENAIKMEMKIDKTSDDIKC